MPAPDNLSFEEQGGVPGEARSWLFTDLSSATEIGGFFFRQNLLAYSEQFQQALFWVPFNATVDADVELTWDGEEIADALVDDATNASHQLTQTVLAAGAGTAFVFSVEAKAADADWVVLASSNGARAAWFDLINGAVGTVSGGASASIEALGDDWYRCTFEDTNLAGSIYIIFSAIADGSVVYIGTGNEALFLARAQLLRDGVTTDYETTLGGSLDEFVPFDGFEFHWGNNHYLSELALDQVETAVFDEPAYVGKAFENFERGWNLNEQYLQQLDGFLSVANFDAGTLPHENFEGWIATPYLLAFGGGDLSAATTDDFEGTTWLGGVAYKLAFTGAPTDLAIGQFGDTFGVNQETFESQLAPIPFAPGDVNAGTDVISIASHGLAQDYPIRFETTGVLPDGIEEDQTYYVGFLTTGTFKITLAPSSGIFIDITDGGSGTHTVVGAPEGYWPTAISSW